MKNTEATNDRIIRLWKLSADRHARRIDTFNARRQDVTAEQDLLLEQAYDLSSRLAKKVR